MTAWVCMNACVHVSPCLPANGCACAFPLEYVHACARLLVWVCLCINVKSVYMHEYGCVHIYARVCAHTCMYTLLWTCVAIRRGVFSVCLLANVVHIKWGSQQAG